MAAAKRKHVTTAEAGAPAGYTAIPVKLSEKQQSPHYLYVKEHKVREGTDTTHPPNRTLFVLNIPPYCTKVRYQMEDPGEDVLLLDPPVAGSIACLSRLFSCCSSVQSVNVCEKPGPREKPEAPKSKFFNLKTVTGFRVAYVVFKNPAGVQAAKSLSLQGPLVISSESHPVKTGIRKWIASYAASVVDPAELKAEVDTFMQTYDKKIAEEEAKAEEEEGIPDEEGWVKVTRKGRRPGLPRTEAASLRVLEREKRKRARKELLNFYAWQHRETKRENIAQLRKKFEEDKQRIVLMRAQRKFRPY
ncbi:ribosomal RNA-processing protein 7 homolog A isoform X1 [Malaclemys terrapin pileata]|uniref:ribosomal RNA-processing protein 7 homolog A isoform X1 n=1 Tax=Malaclemys terrapin pileata TaxID=2991368 RepID=UPI0023A868FA|nr:ribosomal RNA-processing protein 7 homolog A isoform X1 [Malaclemys terrapin pileata]